MTVHVAAFSKLEGRRTKEFATRVHHRGADGAYNVKYYEPSDYTLYWKMKGDGEVTVLIGRDTIPDPLHECIRQDFAEAGVNPEAEDRVV